MTVVPGVTYHRIYPSRLWVAPGRASLSGGSSVSWRGNVLLGHWDESPLRLAGAGGAVNNYNANKGVELAMEAATGRPAPISQLMKAYPGSWETNWATSSVKQSGEFGHAFVITQRPPGSLPDIVAGVYDAQISAWFNSIPTSERAYTCFQNEPDNPEFGYDADLFNRACARVINLGAPIMRARGLAGGIGTVLMGYPVAHGDEVDGRKGTAYFDKWDYLHYVDPVNIPQTVYMIDCYAKMAANRESTAAFESTFEGVRFESVTKIVQVMTERARALYGATRFGLGETGNSRQKRFASTEFPGTTATQTIWVNHEIPSLCSIPGMEFIIYFHKPTGKESQYDQLLNDSVGTPFTTYANMI